MTDGCSIANCDKPVIARGFCSTHYRRLRRQETGETRSRRQLSDPIQGYGEDRIGVSGLTWAKDEYRLFEKAANDGGFVSVYEFVNKTVEAWLKETSNVYKPPKAVLDRIRNPRRFHDTVFLPVIRLPAAEVKHLKAATSRIERVVGKDVTVQRVIRAILEEAIGAPTAE